jgi:2'-5' RNA ligase
MKEPVPQESALMVLCPAAEGVVGAHRADLDRAARAGVPAHVTVIYPFKPVDALTAAEHRLLAGIATEHDVFSITGATTAWFDERVVFVEFADPGPVLALTVAVVEAFPDYLPYAGAHETVLPHLTIGQDHEATRMRAAEQAVRAGLPFTQPVLHLELWAGPALASGQGPWRPVQRYPLG